MGEFNRPRSKNLRIWHWLNFVVISGLMITYLLRKTALNWRENSTILIDKLASFGITIDSSQAGEIAKIFRDHMWEAHNLLGFVFVALLAFRFYAFCSGAEKKPFLEIEKHDSKDMKRAKFAHGVFYAVALYVAISGVVLFFKSDIALSKEIMGVIKTLHKWSVWFFLLFFVAHIVGIVKAELGGSAGLVSDMINGGKR